MCSPSRRFRVQADAAGGTVDMEIRELAGVTAENLGLATWGASVVLADVLWRWTDAPWISQLRLQLRLQQEQQHQQQQQQQAEAEEEDAEGRRTPPIPIPIPILELGAGTGLAGLAASALWQLPAVLTDLPSIVPGMACNVALNSAACRAWAGWLDWARPEALGVGGGECLAASRTQASVILAADTCYTAAHPELVSGAVAAWLVAAPHARAVFCYPLRMAYVPHARALWHAMRRRGLVCLHHGRETSGHESWGELETAIPYEWSLWAWARFWPDAARASERESDQAPANWIEW